MNKRKYKINAKISYLFIVVILLGASFWAGNYTGQAGVSLGVTPSPKELTNTNNGKPEQIDFSTFWEAWNKLDKNYVSALDPKVMLNGAISGLLQSSGDPYTEFFNKEDNKRFKDDISGQFEGIGIEISLIDSLPTVISPLSGSPAEKAGIKARDIILEVDGVKTSDLGFEETVNKIRGVKGSTVKLSIARPGEDAPLEISVVREDIKVASVTSEIKNYQGRKILYVKMRQFGDDTDSLFNDVVTLAKKEKPSSMILDLRNNPGGYLDTAVDISSEFLDQGVIVSEVGRDGKKKDFNTTKSASLKDLKLEVLINGGSASASEILSGALKDRARAKIFGEKSFGKGSVQVMENLSDGSAVKITIAKWLTPKGEHIDKVGISPDVEVKDNDKVDGDEILNAALAEIVK